jgi:hypothetical protein
MAKRRIKKILSSKERRRKILIKRLWRLGFFIFLILLAFGGIIYSFNLPYLRIQNVIVEGVEGDRKEEIVVFTKQTFEGNNFGIIPKNQILFYEVSKLRRNMQSNFAYIQEVKASKKYPRSLHINIEERNSDAIFCSDKCYFIDNTGYIYAEAPSYSEGVYMIFEDETRDSSISFINTYFVDAETYNILNNYIKDFSQLGLEPIKISIKNHTDVQFHIRGNGYILVNTDAPYDTAVQNVKTVLLQEVSQFEYIDARHGNKIFYK